MVLSFRPSFRILIFGDWLSSGQYSAKSAYEAFSWVQCSLGLAIESGKHGRGLSIGSYGWSHIIAVDSG